MMKPHVYTRLGADASAGFLAGKILLREPFLFFRYGDGALECMAGQAGGTRDREIYYPELGLELMRAWCAAVNAPDVFIGDWQSASFDPRSERARYAKQYENLIGLSQPRFLHFESLLLMRESEALLDFYRAVKADRRRKLFMGPEELKVAANMLGAEHLVTPMVPDLHAYLETADIKLWQCDFEVLLYGAGMAANIQAIKCWERFPERTYINLGSALDPIGRGVTRTRQLSPKRALAFLRELL